ncbi:MAG TPA: serine/threonine protein phosphatase, partial [Syntrophobacteraceae bacterium]|nr:serine/threonine protein phosphatase [Syntrophobacteraceae bacterium]
SSTDRERLTHYESYVDYFKTLDWYIASSIRKDEIELPANDLVMRQTLFIAAIFAASLLIAYLLISQLSKHLGKLAAYAKELPSHDFSTTEVGPSSIEPLARKYRDEVGRLAEAFLFMEQELRQYIHNLRETTAAKERIESELQIARDIQMSFLPQTFPPFPDRKEFEIYAMVKPAREVGGDFYDFFFVDEDHLFFSLGDVSGKGVPASLFMAVTKTLLRASAGVGVDPDHVMASVNNRLCDGNDACMFVTVICGILNVRTGEVVCADGGHNPSLYVSLPDEVKFLDLPRAMALGVMEETRYQMERLVLRPGETIFMYTDGITEAMNVSAEMFSEDRLVDSVYRMRERSVKEICNGLMENIEDFSRGAPQADDITMLAIRYRGGSEGRPEKSV